MGDRHLARLNTTHMAAFRGCRTASALGSSAAAQDQLSGRGPNIRKAFVLSRQEKATSCACLRESSWDWSGLALYRVPRSMTRSRPPCSSAVRQFAKILTQFASSQSWSICESVYTSPPAGTLSRKLMGSMTQRSAQPPSVAGAAVSTATWSNRSPRTSGLAASISARSAPLPPPTSRPLAPRRNHRLQPPPRVGHPGCFA